MNAPRIIRRWCKENDLELNCFVWECEGDPDWEIVLKELIGEDKYENVNEVIILHVPSNRFFRTTESSLPYGIESYGSAYEEDGDDVVEVFPREVTVTQYFTKKELREQDRKNRASAKKLLRDAKEGRKE